MSGGTKIKIIYVHLPLKLNIILKIVYIDYSFNLKAGGKI
jgi:hypothetical protein